jgi:hypothetical protein
MIQTYPSRSVSNIAVSVMTHPPVMKTRELVFTTSVFIVKVVIKSEEPDVSDFSKEHWVFQNENIRVKKWVPDTAPEPINHYQFKK